MNDYWFFLSYARRNDLSYNLPEDDTTKKLVRRFYEDLARELISRAQTGQATAIDQIGFFDQTGIELGDKWDEPVAEALRTCKTMLCLMTDNYFKSKVAGQEFHLFSSRLKDYAKVKNLNEPPPLIIPVLWHAEEDLPKPLPGVLSDLQYRHDDYGKAYAANGLEYLMRLKKHEDDYNEFLIQLARRIKAVAKDHTLSHLPQPPALKNARNAFEPAAQPAAPSGELVNKGPGVAHFVFVAGQDQELRGIRKKLEAYGTEGRFWKPYVPEVKRPVGLMTQRAATDVELVHEVMPVTQELIANLEKADDTNTIVVLVIDPWSLNVNLYQQQMQQYDRRNLVSCAVLVVWNERDQEPGYDLETLRQRIKSTFRNSFTNNNMYIRAAVSTEDELRKELCTAILEIRRRLNERAKLFRPVDDAGFNALPQVAVPAGGNS